MIVCFATSPAFATSEGPLTVRLRNNSEGVVTVEAGTVQHGNKCRKTPNVEVNDLVSGAAIDFACGLDESIEDLCFRFSGRPSGESPWKTIRCLSHWPRPILEINLFGR